MLILHILTALLYYWFSCPDGIAVLGVNDMVDAYCFHIDVYRAGTHIISKICVF